MSHYYTFHLKQGPPTLTVSQTEENKNWQIFVKGCLFC